MASFTGNIPSEAWQALDRAVMLHLFDPNVTMIDLGLRLHDREKGRVGNELCVRVHVQEKVRGAAFEEFEANQPDRVIDEKRIGFPVDVPEVSYRPQLLRAPVSTSAVRASVANPLCGGVSISNPFINGYGTLGGLVVDRATGEKMILSNWHVLVAESFVPVGTAIYQPGRGDGGTSASTVATLTRDAMDQMLDAAVAKLSGNRAASNEQLDIGPVTGVEAPQLGMRLVKSGRRTGVTEGIISGIGGRQAMYYRGMRRVIREIVHIAPLEPGAEVSDAGDSGSWWLQAETHRAVGLHFAGSSDPEYGLAIAMPPILDALNIDILPSSERASAVSARAMYGVTR